MPCKRKTIDSDLLCDHYNTNLFRSKLEFFMRTEKKGLVLLQNNNPGFLEYLESLDGLTVRDKIASFLGYNSEKAPNCKHCEKPTRYDSLKWEYHHYCSRKCAMKASNLRIKHSNAQRRLDTTGYETSYDLRRAKRHDCPRPALSNEKMISLIENSTSSSWSIIMKNRHADQLNYIESITEGNSTSEKVYRYLHPDAKDTCHAEGCHNKTSYRGHAKGFSTYCSQKCSHNSAEVKKKTANTCIEKYGVPSLMQNKELMNKQQTSAFKRKDYTFPSGRIWQVQGDEGNIIDYLLSTGLKEEDISQEAPAIEYMYDGRRRKHFPDLFIKDELIIEVKSPFTFEKDYERNMEKRTAAIAAGYEYHFYIWNRATSTVTIITDLRLLS